MAIKGSLKEASLPDVIQLLFLGRRTGCLAVADRQNFGYIYFDDGMIVYASIVNRRDRLGDILVRSRRISADQLQEAIDQQSGERDRKLGELLVAGSAISREELETYMRLQIEEAVYFLFTWTSGTFNFDAGVKPDEDFVVAINPEFLLLEGARRVDEWSLIEKKIPSFDLIFTADRQHAAASGLPLSDEQQRILPYLDGTRDVRQLVDETGLPEFEVGKALYGLITTGVAHRSGTSAPAPVLRVSEQRVDEHRNLGVAFYKAAMLEDAAREFRRVAELRADDGAAPFFLGLIAIRQGDFAGAAEQFRLACDRGGPRAAALHNLAYALERQGRLEEASAAYGEAASRERDDRRVLLGWAIVALKRNELTVALGRLARVRELVAADDLPPIWYWAASLAHALAGDQPEALAVIDDGARRFPQHAVLLAHRGVLLEFVGDIAGAEGALRAALAEDPSLPQASKNLGDVLYRDGRHDEAKEHYERAAKLAPDLGDDVHFKLGNIAFKQRDYAAARAGWERALALNTEHELARRNLAMLEAAP